MGSESFLGNLIHTFRPDLYFYPAFARPQHGGLQRFVSVGFGYRNPVPETLGIRRILIGYDRIYPPTVGLLIFADTVDNETYSKNVENLFKFNLTFPHLI